jgi:molybdopterin synthase catalytic subunit
MKLWVYDVEILGGTFFCVTFKDPKSKETVQIYKLNDVEENLDRLPYFLKEAFLVGYNNKMYDDPIMNKIRKEGIDTQALYKLSQELISTQKTGIPVWKNEIILPYLRYGVKSLDLMKVTAFDKLKIGLKQCAVNLRHHIIQDLPFSYDYTPCISDIPMILKYNENDVDITIRLLEKLKDDIELRINYSNEYKVDVLNASKTYIGKETLNKYYQDYTGLHLGEFKELKTNRSKINVKNCISDKVYFNTPEMQKMLDYFKNYSVPKIEDGIDYLVLFKNKGYQMGFGGLHSIDRPKIYKSTEDLYILDADVDSYYPNVMIKYRIKPKHVKDEFFDILQFITDKRIKAKKVKDKVTADTLKITINSIFGLLNFPNYWLYDPEAALSVTINGQMFLLMLIEALELAGFEVISANTDGVTALVPKERLQEYKDICRHWEDYCKFNLSFTEYTNYIRRDVNNYVALSDEIKQKGCFLEEQKLDKGYNTSIIPKAINNYFLRGIPVEETVKSGTDIFDYCLSEKTGNQFQMEYHWLDGTKKIITPLQKTNRFFISKSGGTLIKHKNDDSLHNAALGWIVTILNEYKEKDLKEYLNNIDYKYYISEANKIIEQIEEKQLTLDIWK